MSLAQYISVIYLSMFVITLAITLYGGRTYDYETFCAKFGASVLWFITWPSETWMALRDLQYRRQQEKKHQLRALTESVTDVDDPNNEILANQLNELYSITCSGHPARIDCAFKRRERIKLIERMGGKKWVEPSVSARTK